MSSESYEKFKNHLSVCIHICVYLDFFWSDVKHLINIQFIFNHTNISFLLTQHCITDKKTRMSPALNKIN